VKDAEISQLMNLKKARSTAAIDAVRYNFVKCSMRFRWSKWDGL